MADPETRLYGMADSSNHQQPADNGLRGEGAADVSDPAYRREVTPPGQSPIVVEETSGVAFAEAGRTEPAPTGEQRTEPPRGSAVPWVIVALVFGFAMGRYQRRSRSTTPAPVVPAALTRMPGEEGGFSQVRNAGQEEIRDPQGRWSAVDQASDESFPASDPPAISMPGR